MPRRMIQVVMRCAMSKKDAGHNFAKISVLT